jgi:hypothetical protein
MMGKPTFEISIPLMSKLDEISNNRKLGHKDRWIKWWQELHPDTPVPDPRHSSMLTFSTAEIPSIRERFLRRCDETPSLSQLDAKQRKDLDSILDEVLGQLHPVDRRKRTSQRQTRSSVPPPPLFPNTELDTQAASMTQNLEDFDGVSFRSFWDEEVSVDGSFAQSLDVQTLDPATLFFSVD